MLYLKLLNDGGPIMWVILAGSLIALFVFLSNSSHAGLCVVK